MRPPIIDTQYKGYRFRSRLEARWAVFFDALGWRWTYEPEGYALPSGWYLPDFWVRRDEGGEPSFFEVKWGEASDRDLARCAELARVTGYRVLLLEGDVPLDDVHPRALLPGAELPQVVELNEAPEALARALRAARGARFEFEERQS